MKRYKIVPVEATEEMVTAADGCHLYVATQSTPLAYAEAETTYAAMLAAAPEPGDDLVERLSERIAFGIIDGDEARFAETCDEIARAVIAEINRGEGDE